MAGQLPDSLKSLQPCIRISKQFEKRDPVVSYYLKMHVVQEGIALAKVDPTVKVLLLKLMQELEQLKALIKSDPEKAEAIENEVVGQAHVEEAAFKLFDFADKADRAGNFDKNMIKAFFTASHIFTALKQFGEVSEDISEKTKYAKWKAVEIDRCLKNGITPTPGPPGGQESYEDEFGSDQGGAGATGYSQPAPSGFNPQPGPSDYGQPPPTIGFGGMPPTATSYPPTDNYPTPQPRHALPPDIKPVPTPRSQDHKPSEYRQDSSGFEHDIPTTPGGIQLGPDEITKAQKHCKFAVSALEYEDIEGAIDFLQKALYLLKTGKQK